MSCSDAKGRKVMGDYVGYGCTHVSESEKSNNNNSSKGSNSSEGSIKFVIGDMLGYGRLPPINKTMASSSYSKEKKNIGDCIGYGSTYASNHDNENANSSKGSTSSNAIGKSLGYAL